MNTLRMVLLNPGPVTITETVRQALTGPDACPREPEFKALIGRVAQRLVDVVHGGPAYAAVILEGSGTAALEACMSSVVPPDGTLLVVANGGYGERLCQIAGTHRIAVVPYRVPWGACVDLAAIETLLAQHRGRVSHVAWVHHETTTGHLNPLGELADLARKHGAATIVDAMSSYAGLPINLQELKVDYLIASASKCMQAVAGLSFVIYRRQALLDGADVPARSFYLDLRAQAEFLQTASAMRFTAPVQLYYALEQALIEWSQETEWGRFSRYLENHTVLVDGLAELGFRFAEPPERSARLVTVVAEPTHPAYRFQAMHDHVYRCGYTVYPDKGSQAGTFRLANIGAIDRHDIAGFLQALRQYLHQHGLLGQLYSGRD